MTIFAAFRAYLTRRRYRAVAQTMIHREEITP
jgi:hypothetical protein